MRVSNGFWKNADNHKKFMNDLSIKLNIQNPQDWNKISTSTIKKNGGKTLLQVYGDLFHLLKFVYPEINWDVNQRNQVPRHYWSDLHHQRQFLLTIESKYKINSVEDWSQIDRKTLIKEGGSHLLRKYKNNFLSLLQTCFPERNFQFFRLQKLSPHSLSTIPQQREYITRHILPKLKITKNEDWYKVSSKEFKNSAPSARTILSLYSDRLFLMLRSVFPEYQWDLFQFPKGKKEEYWEVDENVSRFLSHVKEKYLIEKKEDWFRISLSQLNGDKAISLISFFNRKLTFLKKLSNLQNNTSILSHENQFHKSKNGLYSVLKLKYPHEDWDHLSFNNSVKKAKQRWLYICLRRIFDKVLIHEEFIYPISPLDLKRYNLEMITFDIFIPSFQIALEYHGEHHYQEIPSFIPFELESSLDDEKKRIAEEQQVDLIVIPYWWNNTISSLVTSILTPSRSYLTPFISLSLL